MIELTQQQIALLKEAGYKNYEISHFRHERYDKIGKHKLKEIKLIIFPKDKRIRDQPFVIASDGISLRRSKNIIKL